jgi:hypothetical protein
MSWPGAVMRMSREKKAALWAEIEKEYRLGQLSAREISRKFGISNSYLCRRILKEGWEQDKAPEVTKRVAKKLLAITHQGREGTGDRGQKGDRGQSEPQEADIDAAADEQVSIHLAHRKMVAGFRSYAQTLLAEAQATTAALDEIRDTIDEETAGDRTATRRTMMKRAISLPSRAAVLSSLSSSGRNIQYIERLSHNLAPALPHDEGSRDTGPYQIVQYDDMAEKPYKPKEAPK